MDKEYKKIFAEHILNTPPEAEVILRDALICSISPELYELLRAMKEFSELDVYISTKSLKHAYDRRPEPTLEYLEALEDVFKEPDFVTSDFGNQRADFIFFKQFRKNKFLACPVEICPKDDGATLFCVTFFSSKKSYIKKSTILWSREDGAIPPS